jgi:hypothetical protein
VVEAVMSLLSLAVLAVGLLTMAALVLLLWPVGEAGEAGEEGTAIEAQGQSPNPLPSIEATAAAAESGDPHRGSETTI